MNATVKLLIADDERQIRLGLSEGIPWREHGIDRVLTAENGLIAWEIFTRELPQVVITDIKMPGMSGLQLAEKINTFHPGTVVIILSGFADFSFAQSAIRYGVLDYALKPVNINELIHSVKKGLAAQSDGGADPGPDGQPTQEHSGEYSAWVVRAIEYVRDHYYNDLTAERMAEIVQKTPNYFSGVFKREVGLSFSTYLNKYRVKKAAELLADVNTLVYEAGERVGYHDYKHFVRKFVEHMGETPTAYRKRIMKGPNA